MNYYFTSDTHFGFSKLIAYENLPFSCIAEKDKLIFNNINQIVKEEDTLIHLGDFSFNKSAESPEGKKFDYYRNQIKCKNLILLEGNHDRNNVGNRGIIENMIIKLGGMKLFLTHDPANACSDFKLNLCGHTHGKFGKYRYLTNKSSICDLGVSAWDYKPVHINQILGEYQKWLKQINLK